MAEVPRQTPPFTLAWEALTKFKFCLQQSKALEEYEACAKQNGNRCLSEILRTGAYHCPKEAQHLEACQGMHGGDKSQCEEELRQMLHCGATIVLAKLEIVQASVAADQELKRDAQDIRRALQSANTIGGGNFRGGGVS